MTRRGPHEGSIYERQDGRWEGAVHLGYEDGRRVRKFVIGHSRKETADKMAALLRARTRARLVRCSAAAKCVAEKLLRMTSRTLSTPIALSKTRRC